MPVQAFLDFRGFWFNTVYNSILFSFPLVILSNLDFRGFCFWVFFILCPHINSVNRGMSVQKRNFQMLQVAITFWNDPTYPIFPQSLGYFLVKIIQWHFHGASKEGIWPQKITNSIQWIKSAILAFFQKGPGWPCPVSAALKK